MALIRYHADWLGRIYLFELGKEEIMMKAMRIFTLASMLPEKAA